MGKACIAIGSNLGQRQDAIRTALARLEELPGVVVKAISSFQETEPVDAPEGSGRFINGAVVVETEYSAGELLEYLLQIEREVGRDRTEDGGVRNAPRVLDLDLLLYDDLVQADEELTLPHPRMHERLFVLEPLAEIAPAVVHPTLKKSVRQLLVELQAKR